MIHADIKILIIEDDLVWSVFIESIIIEANFKLLGSANTMLKAKAMIKGLCPDVLICDIRIENSLIFSLLEDDEYKDIRIVFMTSHIDESIFYSSQQYIKSAYLVKPFHKYTLLSTIELLVSKYPVISESDRCMIVRGRQQQEKRILLSEIAWIQAEGNYCYIYTVYNRKYVKKKSLSKMLIELDKRFIKIHKGYIINTNHIKRINLGQRILYINENAIPIGRAFRDGLSPLLSEQA